MSGYIGNIPTPQATQTRETFTATASQTTFNTAGYTPGFVDVWLNGVKLVNGDDFTATNGSDVVLTVGAASGDTVEVLSFSTFEVNSQTFTGDTSAVNLNVTGTFTSRGIDDNATSTAMTLDGSGNLLVGTTDSVPSNNSAGTTADNGIALGADGLLEVAAYKSTAGAGAVGYFNRTSTDGGIIDLRKNGTTVGSIGTFNSYPYFGKGDTTLMVVDALDAIFPRGSNGVSRNDAISLGDSGDRFKDLYLSGGVYLGGTGAANKLDDYEEGTWTPSLSANTAVTYSSQVGQYTKIGNLVVAKCYIALSAWTGTASFVSVAGLPFAGESSDAVYGSSAVLVDNLTSDLNAVLIQTNPSSTIATILANVGRTNSHTGLRGNQMTVNTAVRATIVYQTDA